MHGIVLIYDLFLLSLQTQTTFDYSLQPNSVNWDKFCHACGRLHSFFAKEQMRHKRVYCCFEI